MDQDTITAHAYRSVIDDRLAELLRYRSWYRTNRWAEWSDLRREHQIELRALVKLARQARDLARPPEQADGITAAKGAEDYWAGDHHRYDSDELHAGIEGLPEFNGAFR